MKRALLVLAFVGVAHATDGPAPVGLDGFHDAAPACEPDRTYCFSIHLHVASSGEAAVVTPAWIATQVATANQHFAPISASFRITAVDAQSTEHVVTRADRAAFKPHVKGRVIHVFVTGALDNVDEPDKQIRGVTLRKGDVKYIILSAIAPERVLAHELGHLFGLPHSTYAISIMNKTERTEPPLEQRTFAPEEITRMKAAAKRLVGAKILAAR